ncbi:malonic semialdehyde reductase [Serinibacter salmoneus]|uniref:3-hydroxypropanoate dehydrogenase n=1 Tax=Serinibacter salmoneus TaxID=556530 RepID=A0A2A9CZF2_9MICO|nr:malonic semialdehyde reductase [Serinibacter salmoneus]PFG18979.1 3-hydroxypropanoate dehydrogenase [Serinibacter salmoneus]
MTAESTTTQESEIVAALFTEGRTVNHFTGGEVDPAEVYAAYEVIKWGPTAMNASPLRLAVVPQGQAREALAPHMSAGNRDKTVAAPLVVIAAADSDFHEQIPLLAPHRAAWAAQLAENPEQRAAFARTNALIQIGYLIPTLRSRGLQVGPMAGFDAAGVDAAFFAGSGWRSLLVLNLGWGMADGGAHPRAPRLDAELAVRTL